MDVGSGRVRRRKPLAFALNVELWDRHIEHAVEPTRDLCDHKSYEVLIGDTFRAQMHLGDVDLWLWKGRVIDPTAEVEIVFLSRDHIQVILNLPDYLTAKRRLEESDALHLD